MDGDRRSRLSLIVSTTADAAPCWQPPVTGVVVDPFRAPACTWCAGNRGIEYRVGAALGGPRRRNRPGQLRRHGRRHALRGGRSAGRRRVTYGRLASGRVDVGDVVLAGTDRPRDR